MMSFEENRWRSIDKDTKDSTFLSKETPNELSITHDLTFGDSTPLYKDFFWGEKVSSGYDVLSKKAREHHKGLKEIIEFYKTFVDLEKSYSKSLHKLAVTSTFRNVFGTTKEAMSEIKDHVEMIVSSKQTTIVRLQEDIAQLEQFKCEIKLERRAQENIMEKAMKSLAKEASNVDKTNAQYNERVAEFIKLTDTLKEKRDKLATVNEAVNQSLATDNSVDVDRDSHSNDGDDSNDNSRDLSTPKKHRYRLGNLLRSSSSTPMEKEVTRLEEKSAKARNEAENAEKAYRNAVTEWADARAIWEERFAEFAVFCQSCDESRIRFLREKLDHMTALQATLQSEWMSKALMLMQESIAKIDAQQDMAQLVKLHATGQVRPPLLSFVDVFTGEKTIIEPSKTVRVVEAAKRDAPWRTTPSSAPPAAVTTAAMTATMLTERATPRRFRETLYEGGEREGSSEDNTVVDPPIKPSQSRFTERHEDRPPTAALVVPSGTTAAEDDQASMTSFCESSIHLTSSRDTSPHKRTTTVAASSQYCASPRAVVAHTVQPLDTSFASRKSIPLDHSFVGGHRVSANPSQLDTSQSSVSSMQWRATVKMEGWLKMCDDLSIGWVERWAALEGGYLWFFRTPEDNAKPMGMNKPLSMLSVKSQAASLSERAEGSSFVLPDSSMMLAGNGSELFQQYCTVDEHEVRDRAFRLTIRQPRVREYVFVPPNREEREQWISALVKSMKKD